THGGEVRVGMLGRPSSTPVDAGHLRPGGRVMAKYLLVESRDPAETNDVGYFYDLATNLAGAGHTVTLFLVQNGVFPARRSAMSEPLGRAAQIGVEVLADEFSLRERGISSDRLTSGVKPAPLDVVVDHLTEGRKALWH